MLYNNFFAFMSKLDHPNTVKMYDAYQDNLYVFIVMEFYHYGDILSEIIMMGSFSEGQVSI